MSALAKVQDIILEQNDLFVDRATEIDVMWLATLSRTHSFFVGIPGVAKSMTIRDLVRRIEGASIFEKLFMKDTSRSEVLGNPNLKVLKETGELKFITTNMLPEAHFGFLDEIWKTSSAVGNMMLTILNEREFDNGGVRQKVPLISAFAASNELPDGEETGAIYDRFLLRVHTRDLNDEDFLSLVNAEPVLNGNPTTLTLQEVEELQEAVRKVVIPEEVKNRIGDLRSAARVDAKVEFGPRRWLQGMSVVRAHAFMAGRDEATLDDLEVYQHILWDTLDEKSRVEKVVLGVIYPAMIDILELLDAAREAYDLVQDEFDRDGDKVQEVALEQRKNLMKAQEELAAIGKSAEGVVLERAQAAYKEVRKHSKWVYEYALGMGGDDEF